MRPMPSIVDAMTPFPHFIESSELLRSAINLMYAKDIRHLPVVTNGVVSGILSDRDVKLTMAVIRNKKEQEALRVSDVCVTEPYVVQHLEKLDIVARTMAERHIGSALVTRDGKLVGIFTVTDATKRLAELLKLHYPDA
jgi:acetoin utilization protein AcuB